MFLNATQLKFSEQYRQVVLLTTVNAVSATYACALATSPLISQNCRVRVWDVPATVPMDALPHDMPSNSPASHDGSAMTPTPQSVTKGRAEPSSGQLAFTAAMTKIEAKMREHRTPRPTADVTHMTQFFYGDVSPKLEDIRPMLQRIDVCHGPCADVAAAVAAGALAVESTIFVLVLNAQVLGADVGTALKPYEAFLRAIWGINTQNPLATVAAATAGPTGPSSVTAAAPSRTTFPLPSAASLLVLPRQGSLVVLADKTYGAAAAAMVKTVAAEVPTSVQWFVQLAYVHALDPPALEFGSTEAAVEGMTGLSHYGMLPVLCAANALGVLRHFPVSRSEPATLTPVDVALNAALLGHIFLRAGELPECIDHLVVLPVTSEAVTDAKVSDTDTTPPGATVPSPFPTPRHHMASFAVAESHRPAEASLVWGMFGEYLMGYYGRFAEHITAAFPVASVLSSAPLLQFPFSVCDVVNFGPEPRCPTYLLEGWRAYQDRQRVTDNFHGTEVTRRMQACVQQLDDALETITDAVRATGSQEQKSSRTPRMRASASSSFALPPYCLDDFNVAVYQHMLRRLTTHYALMPYHQCVALVAVDWEAYISVVARAVLVHLAHCVLQRTDQPTVAACRVNGRGGAVIDIAGIAGVKCVPSVTSDAEQASSSTSGSSINGSANPIIDDAPWTMPFGFPEPRRSFTNDLIYHGEARIPPFPSLIRQLFTCTTFLHRTALRSNGCRSDMTPGMTPKMLITILAQPHVQQLMTAMAAKDGVTKAEVEAQAKRILLLAGDTLNHPQCRTMGLMIRETFRRIYHRVNVNHGAFERLHRQLQMPRVALVFVPLHRSYVDFLILSFLLAEMQSPLPHIVASDGFLNMGPIATLMRGSGAFFMRRTFRGDPLYAALFKEYVRQMTLSYRPLEFFMEGTRSRTGKTMAPKMGILKFVCDTFFDPGQQELDDVFFIPVSVSYDELLEATMYAKELLGVPKPKENLSNFFKASSTLKRMHGSINLHLGDPVSLRWIREHPQQCPLPYQPKSDSPGVQRRATAAGPASPLSEVVNAANAAVADNKKAGGGELPPQKPLAFNTTPTITKPFSPTPPSILSSVAWNLTYQLQRNIVITPASMVAALLECFSPYYSTRPTRTGIKKKEAEYALSAPEGTSDAAASLSSGVSADAAQRVGEAVGVPLVVMEQGVVWLRDILLERGAHLSAEAATWSGDRLVKMALGNLHCFVHLTNGMSTVSYQQPADVVTRLGVNISTNQLIHVCIDEALVVVVAQAFGTPTKQHFAPTAERATVCGTRAVKWEVLANQTQLLQRLLSTEFPNYAATSPVSFDSWLECTVSRLQHSRASSSTAVTAAGLRSSKVTKAVSSGEAAAHSSGSFASLPVTPYYYFLLQLICPHLEALVVVLLTSLTLLQTYPGQPLGAMNVVTTAQKTCRSLYEECKLNYTVTANKETLQHYFESLISLSLLQLDHLPEFPRASQTTIARKAKGGTSQSAVVYKAGALGKLKVLERLGVLASQVQRLLWYPGVEAECAVDTKLVKERVLKVYKELMQPSKM